MNNTYDIDLLPESIYDKSESSNIYKLHKIFASQLVKLDEQISTMFTLYAIKNKEGSLLDKIGENLNSSRQNLSDVRYKTLLQSAFLINQGRNSTDDVIGLFKSLFKEKFVGLRELHPGSVTEEWYNNSYMVYLDGSWYLDGTTFLSGDILEPLYFELLIRDFTEVDHVLVNNILTRIKPGAIKYRFKEVA